jgi:hypothetical protein
MKKWLRKQLWYRFHFSAVCVCESGMGTKNYLSAHLSMAPTGQSSLKFYIGVFCWDTSNLFEIRQNCWALNMKTWMYLLLLATNLQWQHFFFQHIYIVGDLYLNSTQYSAAFLLQWWLHNLTTVSHTYVACLVAYGTLCHFHPSLKVF